jgi:hypothetical protein
MLTRKRRLLVILGSGLFLAIIIPAMLSHSPAQADVGVHPVLPGGSSIEPEGDTPIQMAAEVVTMDVRTATEADNAIIQLNPEAYGLQFQPIWYTAVAQVQADFTMNNPTSDMVSLTAWFPLASSLQSVNWSLNPDEIVPRIASFQVVVDGTPIDYTVTEQPNPKGADKPLLPWASFPVTFPAGKETIIHVSYLLPLSQDVKGNDLALYYIFQTGEGWAGPIGQAELILNLPYPASSETLARIPSASLDLPYPMSDPRAVLPFNGLAEGNQVRWTWTNFEPTPQDDFSAWLIDPDLWQKLDAARSAVKAAPQDGQAWMTLADDFRTLSVKAYDFPTIFSGSYLPLGIEAYRKAAELLLGHPAPHLGLAMLTLAPYMPSTNAPSDVIQSIQVELQIAKDLEVTHPEWANEGNLSSVLLDDSLSIYFSNATATAVSAVSSTAVLKLTEAAGLKLTPSVTFTPEPSLTPSTIPSSSPRPSSPTPLVTAVIAAGPVQGTWQYVIILMIVLVILLTIVGFLVLNRLHKVS